uniref:Uncharacterized protein n=1 Tax=Knipowitschia caucasica TaxID=637954 RepID=A0AAV2L512_KNICA
MATDYREERFIDHQDAPSTYLEHGLDYPSGRLVPATHVPHWLRLKPIVSPDVTARKVNEAPVLCSFYTNCWWVEDDTAYFCGVPAVRL